MSRPIKVAHVITRLILGGAQENTLYTVIGQHRSPDYDVTLVIGAADPIEGDLTPHAVAAGVRLVVIPHMIRAIHPVMDFLALWELYRLMRRERFDIVHTHSSKAGILGRVAARLAGVPGIVHTLHSLVFHEYEAAWKNRLYIRLKRWCAPITNTLISVNETTARGALAAAIGRPDQHVTIYSGMDLDRFLGVRDRLSSGEAKARLGIPVDAPVVGKIARFFPLKGHEQFFDMAGHIAAADPRVWFLLIGDGPLRGHLDERARTMGIAGRTVFAGRVAPEVVPECIQAMDVVVHSSLREGIARVLPQAGAVGKPVVTFDMDGAPEVIQEGASGYLVPPLDTAALAARVLDLLRDPARCAAFGEVGRHVAAARFSIDEMVIRINAVYDTVLRGRGRTHDKAATHHV